MNEITTTIVGNLVTDPELRFTSTGTPVAKIRVASTARHFDKSAGRHVDGVTSYLTCTAWRDQAVNLAECLRAGDRVLVTGRLQQRDWETNEGDKRTTFELQVDAIGPELTWATATVMKARREHAIDADAPDIYYEDLEPAVVG